ncbi:MAG TPA: PA2779 family protein [Nitrospirales bacterium]|jgi:hypothetical protein|nr:PA2779 family protein [Nitrospirales bacterium]
MKNAQRTSLFVPMIIWTLVVTILPIAWIPQEGMAMLAPATSATSETGSDLRAEDLQKVQRVLENKLVQQRLEDLGLTPEEVNAKVGGLSDAQLHQMAAQLDALMPGGQISLLITLLLVLAIILLIVILI